MSLKKSLAKLPTILYGIVQIERFYNHNKYHSEWYVVAFRDNAGNSNVDSSPKQAELVRSESS